MYTNVAGSPIRDGRDPFSLPCERGAFLSGTAVLFAPVNAGTGLTNADFLIMA